jgi:hypothetical protein
MSGVGLAVQQDTGGGLQAARNAPGAGLGAKYLVVAGVLAAFVSLLLLVLRDAGSASQLVQSQQALLEPVIGLVALTGVVWLLMVLFRNYAFIRGKVSERYFRTFTLDSPPEWVERPTRAYMNLLELPILFYVVALLMLVTRRFDSVQISLSWLFVATRCAHAFIYIALNYVPLRFVSYLSGVITLAVLWARFAEQSL